MSFGKRQSDKPEQFVISRVQLLWYSFALAAVAVILSLRATTHWLTVMPIALTLVPLTIRTGARGLMVGGLCAVGYAIVILLASMSIGRYFVPSFVFLLAALVIGCVAIRRRVTIIGTR